MAAVLETSLAVDEGYVPKVSELMNKGELNNVAGPIANLVPIKFKNYLDEETLSSYVAEDQKSAQILMDFLDNGTNRSEDETTSSRSQGIEDTDKPKCSNENPAMDTQDEEEFTWSPQNTRLLITLYEERKEDFNKPIKKYIIWKEIAVEMRKFGCKIDWHSCERKFRNLKQHFKTIINHNKKSGNNRKQWEYQEAMQNILKDDPAIFPKTLKGTLSSPNNNVISQSAKAHSFAPPANSTAPQSHAASTSASALVLASASVSAPPSQSSQACLSKGKQKSKKRPAPEWFLDYMERNAKQQRDENQKKLDEIQRMHNETLKIQKEKIDELKKMNNAFISYLNNLSS